MKKTKPKAQAKAAGAATTHPPVTAGYVVGGAAVCRDCLHDAERPDDQTALLDGEDYTCTRCDGAFVSG